MKLEQLLEGVPSVSYTHLTLPTKRIVEISVVALSLKKKNTRSEETDMSRARHEQEMQSQKTT